MKVISAKTAFVFVFTLMFSLLFSWSVNAQWDSQSPMSPGMNLNSGHAFDADTFVVAGEPSAVLWGFRDEDNIFRIKQTRIAEDNLKIVDLHAFSPVSAIVIAEEGGVYISTDRGSSWQETASVPGEPVSIGFFDESKGYIATREGIWQSTDGGENWTQVFALTGTYWRTAVTISESNAIVAGDNGFIAYTTDAGQTWTEDQMYHQESLSYSGPIVDPSYRDIGYDEGTVYLLGVSSGLTAIYTLPSDFSEMPGFAFGIDPQYEALFDIRDGEVILYYHLTNLGGCDDSMLYAYRYADSGNGWELIDSFNYEGNSTGVARILDSDSYLRFGISGFPHQTALGVVSLEDGVVAEAYALKPTQSSGQPIAADIRQLIKTEDSIAAYAYKVYTADNVMCDSNYTFRMMENSRVWRTVLRSPIGEAGFVALKESGSGLVFWRVWQTGGSGLSFTNDFAATTEPLDIETPHKVVDAAWLDDAFLVAVGESGAILFYDGDDLTVAGNAGGPISSITMLDADKAIAVGETGRAVLINRSGEITSLDTPTEADLNAVNAQGDVILASGSGGTILRSTDAGESWSEIVTSTDADLYGIALHESGNGLAVGASGTVLITNDGGIMWEEDTSLTESTLREILIVDMENIWIAGDDGTLFFNDSGGFTSITDPNPGETPSVISLKQNYPNPFNPTTNVEYELSEPADVRLEVFNVLGQSVAVLHDGAQSVGTHTVQFDGSRLTSGVYLVRMQTAGQTFTNKMLLVK